MKRYLLLISVLLSLTLADAQQVSEQEALQKALQFMDKASQTQASRGKAPRKVPALTLANDRDEFFVFNDNANGGCVVISGEERMPDVLAYSYDGHFDADNMPCNMQAWFEDYAEQVRYLRAHPEATASKQDAAERQNIGPLLTCWFGQGVPYNDKCPEIDGKHCVTGCVATAMAQIMHYWQWPKQTTKVIPGYTTRNLRIDIPELPVTSIDWEDMLNHYETRGNYSKRETDAISTLMQLCGSSIEMDYELESSGAITREAAGAFMDYFGYDDLIEVIWRNNYNTDEWELQMYEELRAGRPVLYSGGFGGGHAFVLDGYEDGFFHVNWGWNGSCSYVLMTNDDNWNGFTTEHEAIVGINPERDDIPSRYAVLDDGEMTLFYDKEKASRSGIVLKKEEWGKYKEQVTKCVFDASFADSNIRDLSNFFEGWNLLTSIEGIENLNTSWAYSMSKMFSGCPSLTNLDVSGFKTGNVTDMHYMFSHCSALTSLDVSGFNTGNVKDMGSMFSGCSKLTSLDLSGFNTGNVTDMSYMFSYCSKLTSLNVSGFNTSNVKDMRYMFSHCSGLTSLDVSGFNTGIVTDMHYMFSYCSKLTSLDVSGINTSNVTDMSYMFLRCSDLTSLDLSGFNTGNVKDMSNMFRLCQRLATIYVSKLWDMSNVDNSIYMFTNCNSLIGGAGTTYDKNHYDGEYARIDEGPGNPGYLTYKEPAGIETVQAEPGIKAVYTLGGKKLNKPRKGLNIIRTSDGNLRKIIVR